MNDNDLIQLVRQGLRIAVGATASCVETLQNPQKISGLLAEIQTELNQKTQEWSAKGEITEAEARNFIDGFLSARGWHQTPASVARTDESSTHRSAYYRIQELTADIIALKSELEQLRQSKDSRS